jgi:DNA helicase-2/ATP-dependent DNA helicase PcrA
LANVAPDGDADEPPFDLPQAAPTPPKAADITPPRVPSGAASDEPPFDLPSAPVRPPISARALQGSVPAPTSVAPYLDGLNPEQRAAVEALDGPLLVLAGAGTGKTRVLTTRIAHILAARRAFPGQILSVTFTNKAAREMKERVGNLVGGAVEGMPWLGTFHSIGVKILRRHAELVGLRRT